MRAPILFGALLIAAPATFATDDAFKLNLRSRTEAEVLLFDLA